MENDFPPRLTELHREVLELLENSLLTPSDCRGRQTGRHDLAPHHPTAQGWFPPGFLHCPQTIRTAVCATATCADSSPFPELRKIKGGMELTLTYNCTLIKL